MSAEPNLGHFVRKKPQFGAHPLQKFDISAAAFAERKTFTEINLLCMQPVVNNIGQKFLGRQRRKFAIERDDDRLFDPEHLKIRQPLVKCLQERRGRFRMENRSRMGVERDRRRHPSNSPSTLDHGLHYPLMPKMQPVENAKRQDRRLLDIRVFGAVKDLHTNLQRRPVFTRT